ncbi:MAG: hypothetical protein IPG89_03805 [Bacteroidetes bacterium]|nr:hypothetical protein [Bacteroidota bacterium]
MRIVCVESSSTSACGTYTWGETEDYIINITAAPACSGTPTGGSTASSQNPICPGQSATMSVTGGTTATGLTYQWQSSPDGAAWSNIAGATSSTYVATPSTSTYYRRVTTCTSSGLSANSASLQEVVTLTSACYCTSAATSTSDMDITNFTFSTINNTTPRNSLVGNSRYCNRYSRYV